MNQVTSVLYDTNTGEVLRVNTKGKADLVLSEGLCNVDETIVTGLDLDGHTTDEVAFIVFEARRTIPDEWLSDTSCRLAHAIRAQGEDVEYALMGKADDFAAPTTAERTALVNSAKSGSGRSDVGILCVQSKIPLMAHEWTVDLDTLKLVRNDTLITYE